MQCTHNSYVPEFISSCNCVVVEDGGSRDPAGLRVVSENDELVFLSLVTNHVDTFLDITYKNSMTNCLDVHY